MPNTRKKAIKTVYKDENDSEAEEAAGDFSDSGSDAKISEHSSSEEQHVESDASSGHEFHKSKKKMSKTRPRKTKFAKEFISKINKQACHGSDSEQVDATIAPISVKDLTEADKLLPPILNLSESDSSEDESPKLPTKKNVPPITSIQNMDTESDTENKAVYEDVWSKNIQDDSEEVAKKTFMELEQHKLKIEETKASVLSYSSNKIDNTKASDVSDLLAQGEEQLPQVSSIKKGKKTRKVYNDSDSDMEWEEVKEAKAIPQQGLQLIVDIPDSVCRKSKKLDIEMMMKRKINRVKKEHQVFMHKVHLLCWIAHGNYVSRILNDQEILAAALSMVPSKECYPGERVDMKYVEQITTWYKDKFTLKYDKNEDKYRPKAPPLKDILLGQIKCRAVNSKKYLVFIFVSMLRVLGLQSRIMFNFVTVPLKPPSSELCSLSTKSKDDKVSSGKGQQDDKNKRGKSNKAATSKGKSIQKIAQVDGNDDNTSFEFNNIMQVDGNDHNNSLELGNMMQLDENDDTSFEFQNLMQVDGNDDILNVKSKRTRNTQVKKNNTNENDDVLPPKMARKNRSPISDNSVHKPVDIIAPTQKRKHPNRKKKDETESEALSYKSNNLKPASNKVSNNRIDVEIDGISVGQSTSTRKTRTATKTSGSTDNLPKNKSQSVHESKSTTNPGKGNSSKITKGDEGASTSKYFGAVKPSLSRKRLQTTVSTPMEEIKVVKPEIIYTKSRTKCAPGNSVDKSKYFADSNDKDKTTQIKIKPLRTSRRTKEETLDDKRRVSHRDLNAKPKGNQYNDVTNDIIDIIKSRVKEAKADTRKAMVKGKEVKESDEDSDFLPEELPKQKKVASDDEEDFKPTKISPKPSTSRKRVDRRVLSSDEDTPKNRIDVWCEVFVEELEQWIAVDVINGKAHCVNDIYRRATNPVCYAVGWDNNNYLKDLTRRYVPHWNTVTRKQRAEQLWWEAAVRPWLGPKSARDREEDEQLDRMQLDAPLPKSIAEYKNHPLYALKRHLLKFEALYPADAATLGFVRGEPVYARECVHVCRSRDTWLKEAKVVRLGEEPYKVVKARPKWDRLSNKMITDLPLEVFGPWQVKEYEPPTAENGLVPRNAYGNVELFKECMLPYGTVHIKLPGLNRVAKKLNIDCAPAMTGFDFNGGWTHPVYDGFVVCEEFSEIITDAWVKDQEEQERKELEKIETRVYGNWKRLIKGLLIRERLKNKYGFEGLEHSVDKKAKGPRLVAKKIP